MAAQSGTEFVKFLDIASKTLAMYSPNHPSAQQIVDRTFAMLNFALEGKDSVTISEAEGYLLVDGTLVPKDSPIDHLAKNLLTKSVHSLTFVHGLTRDELITLLIQLNLKPQRIQELGGFAKVMETSGAKNIQINRLRYGIIPEGEEGRFVSNIDQSLLSELLMAMQTAVAGDPSASAENLEKSLDQTTTSDPAGLLMQLFQTIAQRTSIQTGQTPEDEAMKIRFVQLYRSFSPSMQGKLLLSAILRAPESKEAHHEFYKKLTPEELEKSMLHLLDEPLPLSEMKAFVEKLKAEEVPMTEEVSKKLEEKGLVEKQAPPAEPLFDELLKKDVFTEEDIARTPQALSEALEAGKLAEADRLSKKIFTYLGSGSTEQKIAAIHVVPLIVDVLSTHDRWKNIAFSLSFLISTCFRKETNSLVHAAFVPLLFKSFLKAYEDGNPTSSQEVLNTLRSQTSKSEDLKVQLGNLLLANQDRFLADILETTPRSEIATDLLKTSGQKGIELLIDLLAKEEDQKRRSKLIHSISALPPGEVLPAMKQRISDGEWYVIRNMVTILSKMNLSEIPDFFSEAALHADPRVAKELVKVLYKATSKSAGPLILPLMEHPDKTVRIQAIHLAGLHQIENALPLLMKVINGVSPADSDLRTQALQVLTKMKAIDAMPAATMILERKPTGKQEVTERNAAVRLVGELRRLEAQQILQRVAQSDPNPETRALAATYLIQS